MGATAQPKTRQAGRQAGRANEQSMYSLMSMATLNPGDLNRITRCKSQNQGC